MDAPQLLVLGRSAAAFYREKSNTYMKKKTYMDVPNTNHHFIFIVVDPSTFKLLQKSGHLKRGRDKGKKKRNKKKRAAVQRLCERRLSYLWCVGLDGTSLTMDGPPGGNVMGPLPGCLRYYQLHKLIGRFFGRSESFL